MHKVRPSRYRDIWLEGFRKKRPKVGVAKSDQKQLAVLIRLQFLLYASIERLGVVMRGLLAVAFATLMSMMAASAQTTGVPGTDSAPSAFGPDPIIQITTTFRARIEGLADSRDVPAATAQDAARRTLYNMAANECRVLGEFWKADCRLRSFSVDAFPPGFEGSPDVQPQVPSMFGTAVYELRPDSVGR